MNCHYYEPIKTFDLIPTLRARPKYQLSPGSLVVEDAAKLMGLSNIRQVLKVSRYIDLLVAMLFLLDVLEIV